FCHRIRELGYPVKVDTNGSRPAVLAELLSDMVVDCIAMDIKAPLQQYAQLAGVAVDTEAIRQSIVLIAGSGVPHLFRTTFVESLLSAGDLEEIRKLVPIGSPYTVQQFKEVMMPRGQGLAAGHQTR
ncbi:MAG: anaerobic ribonucleoside-triphosphate reductase activating protein, partial [Thermodesulfobacteriota bacterium]